jgi:hypothetical protein
MSHHHHKRLSNSVPGSVHGEPHASHHIPPGPPGVDADQAAGVHGGADAHDFMGLGWESAWIDIGGEG